MITNKFPRRQERREYEVEIETRKISASQALARHGRWYLIVTALGRSAGVFCAISISCLL